MRLVLLCLALSTAWAQEKKRPTPEQRGKELYERHCIGCHGPTNAGDGPTTASLVFAVPNLQGKVKVEKPATDIVAFGKGPMPAYSASFDLEDTRHVLKYMAGLPAKPAPPAAPVSPPAPQ